MLLYIKGRSLTKFMASLVPSAYTLLGIDVVESMPKYRNSKKFLNWTERDNLGTCYRIIFKYGGHRVMPEISIPTLLFQMEHTGYYYVFGFSYCSGLA